MGSGTLSRICFSFPVDGSKRWMLDFPPGNQGLAFGGEGEAEQPTRPATGEVALRSLRPRTGFRNRRPWQALSHPAKRPDSARADRGNRWSGLACQCPCPRPVPGHAACSGAGDRSCLRRPAACRREKRPAPSRAGGSGCGSPCRILLPAAEPLAVLRRPAACHWANRGPEKNRAGCLSGTGRDRMRSVWPESSFQRCTWLSSLCAASCLPSGEKQSELTVLA